MTITEKNVWYEFFFIDRLSDVRARNFTWAIVVLAIATLFTAIVTGGFAWLDYKSDQTWRADQLQELVEIKQGMQSFQHNQLQLSNTVSDFSENFTNAVERK